MFIFSWRCVYPNGVRYLFKTIPLPLSLSSFYISFFNIQISLKTFSQSVSNYLHNIWEIRKQNKYESRWRRWRGREEGGGDKGGEKRRDWKKKPPLRLVCKLSMFYSNFNRFFFGSLVFLRPHPSIPIHFRSLFMLHHRIFHISPD